MIQRARAWLFQQLDKYNSFRNQFEEDKRDIFSEVYDIVVVFISNHPK